MKTLTRSLVALLLILNASTSFAQSSLGAADQVAVKNLESSIQVFANQASLLEKKQSKLKAKAAFWNHWRARSIGKRLGVVRGQLHQVTKARDAILIKDLQELQTVLLENRDLLTAFRDPSRAQEADPSENEFLREMDSVQKRVDEILKTLLRK